MYTLATIFIKCLRTRDDIVQIVFIRKVAGVSLAILQQRCGQLEVVSRL